MEPFNLSALGITSLNEMQQASLEAHRTTNNIVLLSPTGSGKTLAFLLPLLESLDTNESNVQALILTPSRELAMQIEQVFRSLKSGFKIVCCYGGHDINVENRSLAHTPTLVVGTPGRILDHIVHDTIATNSISTIILDEFDKSLEFGFQEDMEDIFTHLPHLRKRTLISATSAVEIPEFTGLQSPRVLDFLENATPIKLTVKSVYARGNNKLDTLYKLLCELDEGPTLIFCKYRERSEEVSNYLWDKGVSNEYFHGGMEQDERERALCKFRNGSTYIFISTDLASRGLDIPEIKYIIHYHIPDTEESFIHRNGRTARMNASGTAFLLLGEEEPLPAFLPEAPETFPLTGKHDFPAEPYWTTLYIGKGKKDKVNKMDIVGFLCQKGNLKKEEIGRIEVKDYHAFVAVQRGNLRKLLSLIRHEKIKNMRTKIELAR
ncbi:MULTISPECIES: DEAD/DEAH box helicase [Odoribacteraceae]|uniref:DEAD/DEAH box helicase n=1 Tax=Odoribacteraceae TaxID=1853231 RepID=UPI000E474232|nr:MULTISPECIES: DEAD/DEAH box helicase [Odoribacteraceae]MCQ4873281.1 DEAD/DEAH box helicase [Butyricimonas paravirosa]RHR79020.1 ATP-dependent helicase [Odoribacter sp. AF15-53]